MPFSLFKKAKPSAIPAKGEGYVFSRACSGMEIKSSNTQKANIKLARSINKISGSPPAAYRNAASMGLNTTNHGTAKPGNALAQP